jgi:outer membrane biosynthesis protein TonB
MNRRMLTLTATLSAALCLIPASLAVAGEDDPTPPPPPPAEQPVPQPVPVVPQPVPPPAPAPAPVPQPAPAPQPAAPAPAPTPKAKARPTPVHRTVHQRRQSGSSAPVTHTTLRPVATTIQVSTVPVGSVQAGGGATAETPSHAGLLGLGAGLVLVATAGGGLALRGRREHG